MRRHIIGFCLFSISVIISELFALSPPDPLLNDIQTMSMAGLSFANSGTNAQIALFVINSNSGTGFEVTFKFANGCKFKSGAREIPITALLLDKVSGTLGEGLTEPVDLDVLNNLNGNEYVWKPGETPTTETSNYIIELKGSWDNPAGKLAGFYFERIEATISVGGL